MFFERVAESFERVLIVNIGRGRCGRGSAAGAAAGIDFAQKFLRALRPLNLQRVRVAIGEYSVEHPTDSGRARAPLVIQRIQQHRVAGARVFAEHRRDLKIVFAQNFLERGLFHFRVRRYRVLDFADRRHASAFDVRRVELFDDLISRRGFANPIQFDFTFGFFS